MSNRQRMTWAARARRASPPPATPGYGTPEMGDHPGAQPDPGAHDYENGDTSSWAEDPHPPPYEQSAAPATPGYGTPEMGEHPAAKAASLKRMVERKAAKCLRVASALMPGASGPQVEARALDLMDTPDAELDATLNTLGRMAGGFMAGDDDLMGCGPGGPMAFGGLFAEDDEDEDIEAFDGFMAEDDMPLDAMMAVEDDDVEGMLFGQGDLFVGEDDEEEAMLDEMLADESAIGVPVDYPETPDQNDGINAMRLASLGFDSDGFARREDWRGTPAMFDLVDYDDDGIITASEFHQAVFGMDDLMLEDEILEDEDALDLEEQDMLDEMLACQGRMAAEEDEKEGEDEEEEADKTAADDDDADEGDEEGGDEDDEGADKEASVFSMTGDPMGLSGEVTTTPEEQSLLDEVFGVKYAAEEEEEETEEKEEDEGGEEEEETEEKEEVEEKEGGKKKKAALRPKPRKKSAGVKSLGNVSKTAGATEIDDLSKLWNSAPDVSDVFNP